jgi:hypothetical protein
MGKKRKGAIRMEKTTIIITHDEEGVGIKIENADSQAHAIWLLASAQVVMANKLGESESNEEENLQDVPTTDEPGEDSL